MNTRKYLLCISAILSFFEAFSQQESSSIVRQKTAANNSTTLIVDSVKQTDLIDILQNLLDKKTSSDKRKLPGKASFSVVPYGGYTLSTGFSINLSGNVGFFTDASHNENLSVLATDLSYDSKKQKIFLTRSELWANENKYKVVTDLRWEKYPTDTYGLGTFTSLATDNVLDYYYVRVYETVC